MLPHCCPHASRAMLTAHSGNMLGLVQCQGPCQAPGVFKLGCLQ